MLFSIAMALMVILVAGFWTYQGFYSAVLMFFECVIAALIAFGFYESLNGVWAASLGASLGRGLAFLVLFLVPLAILRFLTDRLFPDNVKLPVAADRAGAAVFGLLAGLMLIGTPLVGIQMLPIGSTLFGFERISVGADGGYRQSGLLLGPDSFAVVMANIASSGSMSGANALARSKPNLLLDLYGARCCVQTGDRHDVPPDAVIVHAYWEARQIDYVRQRVEGTSMAREFDTREAPAGRKYVVVNLSISKDASMQDKSEIYFRLPQFRIVGPPLDAEGRGPTPSTHLAAGMSDLYINREHNWHAITDDQAKRLVRFNPTTDFVIGPNQTRPIGNAKDKNAIITHYRFDVAFEVPESFEPWFVTFKNGARAELIKSRMFKQTPPDFASTVFGGTGPGRSLAEADKPKVGKPQGGATHVANAVEEGTSVAASLPFVLSRGDATVARALKGGKLGECHLWVELPDDPPSGDDAVKEFFVAGGKAMVQIAAEKNTALSMYGRALNYASNVAGQITISTADGKDYIAQGVYSAARIGGKMILEIQYIDNADESDLRLKPPKKIKAADLRNAKPEDRKFGYVFIVDPGVKIVSFSSGGQGGSQPLNINVP